MHRAKTAHLAALAATLIGLLGAGACTTTPSTREVPVTAMLEGPGGPGTSAVSQLDYFDALSRRSTVTWDEMLAGVLMAAGKRADGAYADRVAAARHTGILGTATPPASSTAATPGELARLLLRAQGVRIRDGLTDEEVLSLASRRSLVSASLTPADTLSGEIAVNALAAAGKPTGVSGTTARQNNATPSASAGGSTP